MAITRVNNLIICDTEAERNLDWKEGQEIWCKDTEKKYIIHSGAFLLVSANGFGVGGDLSGTLPNPTVYQVHLTDQAAPSAPASGTLILQSFNQQGFSVPHVYDAQGNAIEITRDNIVIVKNTSGSTISKGNVVYVTGSSGSIATVSKAKADSTSTLPAVGIMYESTGNNSFGRMMILGNLEQINLSSFNNGDLLYVSDNTAGALTSTKPTLPSLSQSIGIVLNNGVGNGVLQVFIRVVQGIGYSDVDTDGTLAANSDIKVPSQKAVKTYVDSRASAILTFTNKRITKRTGTVASNATPTINTDNVDYYSITALAVNITSMTTNLSGTPNTNDTLWISITDNGTSRTITWGSSFEASGTVSLPTATIISTRLDCKFVWNESTSKWRIIGTA